MSLKQEGSRDGSQKDFKDDLNSAERVDEHHEKHWNLEDAITAEATETAMSPLEALKKYPKAAFWSFAISLCLIMEGYDTTLLGNVIVLPAFRQQFGNPTANSGYQLTAAWQSAIGYAPTLGAMIGILASSWYQDRYGYRRTIQACLVMITTFIFIVFFATSIEMLFVGEFLCGIPWGAFSTSAVGYASEVTPVPLRGYLTTYVNMCWLLGQIVGAGIIIPLTQRTDEWSYRILFAIQWLWPIPIFILVTLAPESPWFLVRAGKMEAAEKAVSRLASRADVSPAQTVAMMARTNEIELANAPAAGTSYLDCFKGTDRRRTEIVCIAWLSQILTGSPFANHPAYFFQQAGIATTAVVQLNLGQRGTAIIGAIGAWFIMAYCGRRKMLLSGMTVLCLTLFIIGVLGAALPDSSASAYAQAGLTFVWVLAWNLSIAPLAYAIVGETSSTRLRGKTIGLGRCTYNIGGVVGGILNTYQMSSSATGWNWKGKASFFWAGLCFISLVWTYFRLPEMKGRSFRELDILFERRISARRFNKTKIEATEQE